MGVSVGPTLIVQKNVNSVRADLWATWRHNVLFDVTTFLYVFYDIMTYFP